MIEISGFAQAHCILGSALAGEGLRSASMAAGSHGRNCDEGTNSSTSLYSIGKCSKTLGSRLPPPFLLIVLLPPCFQRLNNDL